MLARCVREQFTPFTLADANLSLGRKEDHKAGRRAPVYTLRKLDAAVRQHVSAAATRARGVHHPLRPDVRVLRSRVAVDDCVVEAALATDCDLDGRCEVKLPGLPCPPPPEIGASTDAAARAAAAPLGLVVGPSGSGKTSLLRQAFMAPPLAAVAPPPANAVVPTADVVAPPLPSGAVAPPAAGAAVSSDGVVGPTWRADTAIASHFLGASDAEERLSTVGLPRSRWFLPAASLSDSERALAAIALALGDGGQSSRSAPCALLHSSPCCFHSDTSPMAMCVVVPIHGVIPLLFAQLLFDSGDRRVRDDA